MKRMRTVGALTLVYCLLGALAANARGAEVAVPREISGRTLVRQQTLPVVPLRGYKSLGGEFAEYQNPAGTRSSSLVITCADDETARIVLAKYRSDLRCLGGIREAQIKLATLVAPIAEVEGQGWILAVRQGSQVWILAAEQRADLEAHAALLLPLPGQVAPDFTGAAQVPMFLDKFDRYGWSFWYAPLTAPPKQEATYDFRQDYDYARRMGVGLQLQINPSHQDTGEAVIDTAQFSWAMNLARDKGVPVFLQPMLTGPLWVRNLYPDQMQLRMPQYVGNYYAPNTWDGGDEPAQIAWSSVEAKEALLAPIGKIVRHYRSYPNVTGYLEPHAELEHNMPAIFSDFGEVADAAYRTFLKERYQTPAAVDQRWHGGQGVVKSWPDVRVPEVASFLGWGQGAKDLQGLGGWPRTRTCRPSSWRVGPVRNSMTPLGPRWWLPAMIGPSGCRAESQRSSDGPSSCEPPSWNRCKRLVAARFICTYGTWNNSWVASKSWRPSMVFRSEPSSPTRTWSRGVRWRSPSRCAPA